MRKIKDYRTFVSESINQEEMFGVFKDADILESIVTNYNELLTSIKAEEVNIFQTFNLSDKTVNKNTTIEDLFDNKDFNDNLKKMKLKKNYIEYSTESETFLEETINIKFFTVHDKDKSQLERPEYIIFQSQDNKSGKWEEVKCYKVNDDMRKFYDKLSNKTIELKHGDKSYVYSTSNCADWILMKNDIDQDTSKFKDNMSNNDIKSILNDKSVTITIMK